MLVSNAAGFYLVLFAVVMGIAALIALFVGACRAGSSTELQAKAARSGTEADASDVSPE